MLDINYYKKYMNCHNSKNFNEYKAKEISKDINSAIEQTINGFVSLINSDRADSIFKNDIEYRCIIDYKKKWRKTDMNPLWEEIWVERSIIDTGDILKLKYRNSIAKNDCLVVSNIEARDGYDVAFVQKCNHVLKWMDKNNGDILQSPSIVTNKQLYTTGVAEDKFSKYNNSKENLLLPSNEITSKLLQDTRLIINGNYWRVTFINRDKYGLLDIMCEQDKINNNTDNLELGIADYYKYQNNYDFKILNKNPILSTLGTPTTLDIQCFKNDDKIENPILKYTISDDEIAKIEDDKIVGLKCGTCHLAIEYEGIKKIVDVHILENQTSNLTIQIEGKSILAWGRKTTYEVTFVDNGQPYDDICEFTLTDEDDKNTKLAKIIEIDKQNCTCTIEANHNQDEGIVILHCKNRIGNEEIKKVEIMSAWIADLED